MSCVAVIRSTLRVSTAIPCLDETVNRIQQIFHRVSTATGFRFLRLECPLGANSGHC